VEKSANMTIDFALEARWDKGKPRHAENIAATRRHRRTKTAET
jgi:hypothetical protein